MKKRLLSAFLSVCMLLTCLCFATAAFAADGDGGVYSIAAAYKGDAEQGPEWFYMGKIGDEDWAELHYYPDYGDNWQIYDNPESQQVFYSFCDWGGVAAQAGYNAVLETVYKVAAVFQAPKDGEITIAPWRYVNYVNVAEDGSYESIEGSNYLIYIKKNDEVLFTGKADGTLKSNDPITTSVVAGDKIWFEIDPNGSDGGTILMNDLAVAYDGAALPEQAAIVATAGEGTPDDQSAMSSGTEDVYSIAAAYKGDAEQGPEWFYMGKIGDEDWAELHYYPDYGDNWQIYDNPESQQVFYSFCDWGGVAAQAGYNAALETVYKVAAVFQAPRDGEITIAPWRYVNYVNVAEDGSYESMEGSNYLIYIKKNDEVLFTGKADGTLKSNDPITTSVVAGDKIWFEIDPNGSDGGTILMNDLAVAYDGAALPEQAAIVATAGEGTPDDQSAMAATSSEEVVSEEVSSEDASTEEESTSSEVPAATEETPAESGVNAGVIVGIVIAVIVIAAIVIVVVMQKKKNSGTKE